jgi:hypothetical protein
MGWNLRASGKSGRIRWTSSCGVVAETKWIQRPGKYKLHCRFLTCLKPSVMCGDAMLLDSAVILFTGFDELFRQVAQVLAKSSSSTTVESSSGSAN